MAPSTRKQLDRPRKRMTPETLTSASNYTCLQLRAAVVETNYLATADESACVDLLTDLSFAAVATALLLLLLLPSPTSQTTDLEEELAAVPLGLRRFILSLSILISCCQ